MAMYESGEEKIRPLFLFGRSFNNTNVTGGWTIRQTNSTSIVTTGINDGFYYHIEKAAGSDYRGGVIYTNNDIDVTNYSMIIVAFQGLSSNTQTISLSLNNGAPLSADIRNHTIPLSAGQTNKDYMVGASNPNDVQSIHYDIANIQSISGKYRLCVGAWTYTFAIGINIHGIILL